jgi:RND family efflux transporter MFP subunit
MEAADVAESCAGARECLNLALLIYWRRFVFNEMKKWIIISALVIVGISGFCGWKAWHKSAPAATAAGRPTTATAELRDINFAVNAAGEIAPAEQVSVRPEINGLVLALPVDIGDRVKKDDLLFRLDDSELQRQKASSLTEIERAKLGVEKAVRDYQRSEKLLDSKLISQELFDDTKTALDLSSNALERAEKDLELIGERLTKTVVRAPFDCTVLTRPVSVGQAVSGSGGFNSGTEVLTIADLSSMIINAQVNQADVPRLKIGQSVEVTVEAVAGLTATGVVERISPQATIRNSIKGYPARVVLKNVDPRARPGMTANVKIPVASADNVTAVPLGAVFTELNPDTGQRERYVYIQQGDSFEKRNVKVGVSDYSFAEIQEGLSAGAVVALELPKDEFEKRARQLSAPRTNSVNTAPGAKPKVASSPVLTNSVQAAAASTNVSAKILPVAGQAGSTNAAPAQKTSERM